MEGIRKLSDLNTVRGNNTRFISLRWYLVARMSSFEQELVPQIRYESVECDPVPEDVLQYLRRYCTTSETKPKVGILITELVVRNGSIRLTEQDDCTTKREPCHSGEPPEYEKSAVTCE